MALRVGLIGCGDAAQTHLRGWLSLGGRVRVVALADPDIARRRALRDQIEHQRPTSGVGPPIIEFDDYRELFARAQLDAVDISVPHDLHCDCIREAAARLIHWLCEKPLCINRQQAAVIEQTMAGVSAIGMCAHNQMFMPALAEAKRMLLEGYLGRVYTVVSQGGFRMGQPPPGAPPELVARYDSIRPGSWRTDPTRTGGGELIDTGYHPCYRLLHLAGEVPQDVIALTARHRVQHIAAEDTAEVLCRFPSGAIGHVRTSWAMELPAGQYSFHVIGERGELFGGSRELYYQPPGMQPAHAQFAEVDTFVLQIRHFVDCIEQGVKPAHTYQDALRVMDLIFRAYEFVAGRGPG